MDHLFNTKMETMSRKKIQELQLDRLQKTVHLVYKTVPHYKKKFKELHVIPEDIKTLADIRKLPTRILALPRGKLAVERGEGLW